MSKTVSPEQNTMCRIAQKRNERLSGGAFWRVFDTVFYLVLVVVVTIAIRATLLEPIRVNGTSMTETLQSSDYLFTEKLSYGLLHAYLGRIINVQPALFPAFCTEYFDPARAVKETLRRGVRVTGATAYFMGEEDNGLGPIITQRAVEVLPEDTAAGFP